MALLRTIVVSCLAFALLAPSGFKAYHALADHLESSCDAQCQSDLSTHLHEREFHCSFDHFVLSPFQISFLEFTATEPLIAFFKLEPLQDNSYVFHLPGGKMLRAPPVSS
ncbi:hypothetical protein SAMN04490243_1790 [Robiginitalea myxolifaciens]|uniref:Uncharacterized protein n=1 Tax=Robiginitalea myxolifaciens TaxID=400055 RepID=A0A1I6GVQ4_9FLAO|nr:hypothetical protein SAMN04490243_1790 [Robiginitalea myxolifaciens]